MNDFLEELKRRHQLAAANAYPATGAVDEFVSNLLNWLFPEHTGQVIADPVALEQYSHQLEAQLQQLLQSMERQLPVDALALSRDFMNKVPVIYDELTKDAAAIYQGDPAASCLYEVIRAYPGFYAIAFYRMAHALYQLKIPVLPRMITELAHSRTGVDIHPGAVIAPWCCIDHGTGIVIGETTIIGPHVKLYQGVTLGALSIEKSMARSKRHPTIEEHVVIYAGATILGGDTVIGHHSVIGGNIQTRTSTMASIIDLIGNTPMVELKKISVNPAVKIFAKLEGNNPAGSVKDRAAYGMIKGALDRGDIKPGMKLIEATSGNTGIALAMIASLFGLEIELVMPSDATRERVLTMEVYGAKVTLTPKELSMEGSIDYANDKAAKGGYFMLNQFANPDNYGMHYKTTGPEIWKDTDGQVTHFVSAMGTTGTIMGVSRFLKEQNPAVQIVGCQPTDGSKIPGIRKWPEAYLPKIFERPRIDRIMDISEEEARTMTKRLAKEEAVFCGMSSGGAVAAAVRVSEELRSGVIVSIICDRGDRYLSSDLFS
ncbi:hypothetical protein HA402_013889 [Bradysia odoriphaga]|nr:hypothetical protein HA402_013889 [Bradysia odoriphaga]